MRKQSQTFVHSFTDMDSLPFSAEDYSRLKFGCNNVARKFGHELADTFFAENADLLIANQCVVIPSPYNHVQNAASVMTRHFVDHLNHLLVNANGRHVETSTVHRKVSYTNDYGFLSKEKRRALIDNDVFFLNRPFLADKMLVFIDDVCITGTHEDKLVEILDNNNVSNRTFFLYYAKYAKGAVGADIESKINFAGISSVDDFFALTQTKDHNVIVRAIKFLLGLERNVFDYHIDRFDRDFLTKVYYGALGEGYHTIPKYQHNLRALAQTIGK